jgi:hypothetical protein
MSDDFDRRVRALHESPFTLASIRIRARAIRRRRRLAAVVSLVALGLGVVPVGVLVLSLHGPTLLSDHLSAERRTSTSPNSEGSSVPSACGSSTDRQSIAVESNAVGYASPRSAVRTRQEEGALIELSKSSDDAQILAITPRGESTTLFAVSLLANGWMVTGEIRC